MALTSRLKVAEDALLAAIQTQAAGVGSPLAAVALQLGNPGLGRKAEHVWIGEEATAEQSWAYTQQPNLGEKAEVVELHVFVTVQRGGGDYDDVRDRLQVLAAEVEKAVLADSTLGGAVFDSEVIRIDRAGGRHEKGWTMAAELAVRVTDYH
jgi:hypothetical protein